MSDQKPSPADAPGPQSQESLGSAPPPRPTYETPPIPPPAQPAEPPQESLGSASPAQPARETLGSAPLTSAEVGAAPHVSEVVAASTPAKPKRRGLLYLAVGIVAALIIIIVVFVGAAVFLFGDSPATAKVGSCLSGSASGGQPNPDDMKVVDCADTNAGFRVAGRLEDKTVEESKSACQAVAGSELFLWFGSEGEKGTALCLATITK